MILALEVECWLVIYVLFVVYKAREEGGREHTTGAAEANAIRAAKGTMYFMLVGAVLYYSRKEKRVSKLLLVCILYCKLNEWIAEV